MSMGMVTGRIAIAALAGFVVVALSGCSGVLPKRHDVTVSAFKDFDDARGAYDRIVINSTKTTDLVALGLDPEKTPNVRQLTYLQIIQAFMPRDGVPMSSLPQSVQSCIAAQTRCIGYAIAPRISDQKRVGSIALDFFNFRRKTVTTGWEAESLFVILDGVVVYKLWSGEPNVNQSTVNINPLGPLQNLGTLVDRAIPAPTY